MGWLIALGVLTLIAIIPVGVSALYDEDGPCVRIIAGPIRIKVFPLKKKEKKAKKSKTASKQKSKSKPAAKATKDKKEKKNKGGSITDFLPLVDTALDFVAAFGRRLRVHTLQLKLILAGGDPCDLAVNYGRGWAALSNLMPLLERAFVIQKRNLEVECDFVADKTTIIARLDLSITIGRVFSLLIVGGIPIVREFLKFKKTRKGGAKA